jgi:hypothetical protein
MYVSKKMVKYATPENKVLIVVFNAITYKSNKEKY